MIFLAFKSVWNPFNIYICDLCFDDIKVQKIDKTFLIYDLHLIQEIPINIVISLKNHILDNGLRHPYCLIREMKYFPYDFQWRHEGLKSMWGSVNCDRACDPPKLWKISKKSDKNDENC